VADALVVYSQVDCSQLPKLKPFHATGISVPLPVKRLCCLSVTAEAQALSPLQWRLPVVLCTVQFSAEVLRSVTLPYAGQSPRTAWNLQGVPLRLSVFTVMSLGPV